jgi:hypothetical protein
VDLDPERCLQHVPAEIIDEFPVQSIIAIFLSLILILLLTVSVCLDEITWQSA